MTSKANDRSAYFLYSVDDHKRICDECGHSWDHRIEQEAPRYPTVCPECGERNLRDFYEASKVSKNKNPLEFRKLIDR